MKRPFDAVILVATKLKENGKAIERIGDILREVGELVQLSPRDFDALFAAFEVFKTIPQETIEQELPNLIKDYLEDYLATEEGAKIDTSVSTYLSTNATSVSTD